MKHLYFPILLIVFRSVAWGSPPPPNLPALRRVRLLSKSTGAVIIFSTLRPPTKCEISCPIVQVLLTVRTRLIPAIG